MSTSFKEIRELIRPLIQDVDPIRFVYSDQSLNQNIKLVRKMKFSDLEIEEVEETEEDPADWQFIETITSKQEVVLALETAISIVSGWDNDFHHKDPNQTVTRSGGTRQLFSYLKDKLQEIEGGSLVIATDHDFEAIINYPQRLLRDLSNARISG